MQYYPVIIPFFEANTYLTLRYAKERTSFKIDECSKKSKFIGNFNLAYFNMIVDLEKELDDAFPDSDLLRYYFTPMETINRRSSEPLTIGGMLLAIPHDMKAPYDYYNLIKYLKTLSKIELLYHFYQTTIIDFVAEPSEKITDLSDFLQQIDRVLVNSEDKWNMIAAAGDPFPHLEKLSELVSAISDRILTYSVKFTPLLEDCRKSFLEVEPSVYFQDRNISLIADKNAEAAIYPSIFSFNNLSLTISTDGSYRIIIGFFVDMIIKTRKMTVDADSHISLLKALSDGQRFRALYSIRSRYSFGQELADELGGTRNAMYYHLKELMSIGLIDCKVTDYRMLYTMNKRAVYEKLTALRDFLVGGWTPGDDEGQEDEPQKEKVLR